MKMDRDEQGHGACHGGDDTKAEAEPACSSLTHFTGETNDTCQERLSSV